MSRAERALCVAWASPRIRTRRSRHLPMHITIRCRATTGTTCTRHNNGRYSGQCSRKPPSLLQFCNRSVRRVNLIIGRGTALCEVALRHIRLSSYIGPGCRDASTSFLNIIALAHFGGADRFCICWHADAFSIRTNALHTWQRVWVCTTPIAPADSDAFAFVSTPLASSCPSMRPQSSVLTPYHISVHAQ